MKVSWSQALPAALLVLEVSAGKKCQHPPAALSSTSSSASSAQSTSSSASTPATSTSSVQSSSSSTTSSTTESSSASLTQSSASATTLSSSIIVDKCSAGLLDPTGTPDRLSRLADCSALNRVTVTPPVQTTTSFTTTYTTRSDTTSSIAIWTITTTSPSPLAKRTTGVAAAGGVTATGLDGTVTVKPTATPAYATYCDGYEQYYSACSDGGVTALTTTAPGVTSTATSTVVITCIASYYFTQYIGVPFPTALIPRGFTPAQPTTYLVGADALTTSVVG